MLQSQGLLDGYGHLSARLPGDRILSTPHMPPGKVALRDLIVIDMEGKKLESFGEINNEPALHRLLHLGGCRLTRRNACFARECQTPPAGLVPMARLIQRNLFLDSHLSIVLFFLEANSIGASDRLTSLTPHFTWTRSSLN